MIATTIGQTAHEYMTKIDAHYLEISERMWDYTSTVARSKNSKKIDQTRQDLITSVRKAKNDIARMSGYENNTEYRDSVISWLVLQDIVLTENYEEILDMEEIAEQSYDLMEAYLLAQKEAGKMMDDATEMLNEEQAKFGKAHNINIVEDDSKLGKKLNKASDVYDYYNPIYLMFFKSYKQEVYLIASMEADDINAIEQNRKALISMADEDIKNLIAIKAYDSDLTLRNAALMMLRFYKKEAEKDAKVVTDFYLKKETYEKINVAFEKMKKKDRTQENVDRVNKAANEYNEAVQEYNEIIKITNKERTKNLDAWNKAVSKFLKSHISR